MGRAFFMINKLSEDLKEATARIAQNRLLAWSSDSGITKQDKIALKPLTAKAWVDLNLIDNAIALGADPSEQDLIDYIWRNCSEYNPKQCAASEKAKRRIGYAYGKSNKEALAKLVFDHVNNAFSEMPETINTKSGFSRDNKMSPIAGIVGAIDEVAARYGQNPADVLTWPLNRIFQLQKAMRLATIPDYKLAEPKLIKLIKQEILQELNNGAES